MPSITSSTSFTLARGSSVIFELGGTGTATVDPTGSGNTYRIGQQEAFLGPYPKAVTVVVVVSGGSINYRIDGDGNLDDQTPPFAALGAEVEDIGGAAALPSICFLGDSITRDSWSQNATQLLWTQWGWVTHFRRMVRGRATVDMANVFAVAGMGVVHLNSTQIPQAIASGCKIACVKIGTNDVGSVDIVAGLETAYQALMSAGIKIIASPILPHSTPSSFTADQRKIVDRVNQYIAQKAATAPGFVYAQTLNYVTDFATGDALSGILRDGIHTTPAGAYQVARGFYQAADAILPLDSRPILVASNSYDATTNPNGDILANGLMIGTSGTARTGASGTVPNNWYGQRSSGGSTTTCVCSKETDSATGVNKAVITIGGTGDGAFVGFETNTMVVPAGITAGSVIELEAYAEWSGLQNILGVYGRIRGSDGTTVTESFDGFYSNGNGVLDLAGDGAGWISLQYIVPTGQTSRDDVLQVATKSASAVAGVVKFSRAAVRKVA